MTSLVVAAARELIYQRFVDRWLDLTPYVFNGEPESALEKGVASYAVLGVEHEPRKLDGQQTMGPAGSRRFLREGRVWIRFSVIEKAGYAALDALAKPAQDVFEASTFSGVRMFDSHYREITPDGKWKRGIVETEFNYQEIK